MGVGGDGGAEGYQLSEGEQQRWQQQQKYFEYGETSDAGPWTVILALTGWREDEIGTLIEVRFLRPLLVSFFYVFLRLCIRCVLLFLQRAYVPETGLQLRM